MNNLGGRPFRRHAPSYPVSWDRPFCGATDHHTRRGWRGARGGAFVKKPEPGRRVLLLPAPDGPL
jgi:hypothetical protein